jgi:CubicO group peptidase (beta-lactamase class C family)
MGAMSNADVQRLLESVSSQFRGPGGVCALLKDGEVIGQHAWGYADLEKRIPMTAYTILPICSISKQFVCLVLADLLREPGVAEKADAVLHEMLPQSLSDNKDLTIDRLAHMQSGIRDYWALSVLWGAQADGRFTLAEDAPKALPRLGNFHFPPGKHYSYSNVNFYILGRIAEELSGKPLENLLAERVFKPAGMSTAELHPDTADLPGPCIGYEGVERYGFFRAVNRMEWSGDAGIVASLQDMMSYEMYLDKQYADSNSSYRHNAQAPNFIDGSPAFYGWGLSHNNTANQSAFGHGGALRGFRLHRRHAPDARMSVVVMFNHEADPEAALTYLLQNALSQPESVPTEVKASKTWEGVYLDPETELAIQVTPGQSSGKVMINFSFHPETLSCTGPDVAQSRAMTASISDDVLTLQRPRENRTVVAHRIKPASDIDCSEFTGEYRSDEIDSTFHVTGSAGMLYGSFDGYLGKGPAHLMKQLGENTWYMSCQRSLDAQAPGDWTVLFKRDSSGKVTGVTVGCWLARKVPYTKV